MNLAFKRTPPAKVCADCGAEIRKGPMHTADGGKLWGEQLPDRTWSYACRWTPGKKPGSIASADYHYVEGEEQRHFYASEPQ